MYQNREVFTVTNIIILVTLLMYVVQTNMQSGSVILGLNVYFFTHGLYHQLVSTMFTHGGIAHLLMNMFVLWQFGNLLEQYMGKIRFLLLYFVGGILTSIGTLVYMYYTGDWGNVVGASGAISVILGYFALKDRFQRNGIIVWVLLISFAPLLLGMPIAWYSHLIGFVLGWLIGYIL